MRFWLVTRGRHHVIVNTTTREYAKKYAHSWFGGDPDHYVVTPLTEEGDIVRLEVVVDI